MTKRKIPIFSVGLFLLVGLSLLGWMLIQYGGTNKIKDGYSITVEFSDASGIIKGGVVRLAGANVGYIVDSPTLNENQNIEVPIMLKKELMLPANTRFEIVSLSMLGDKAIYVRFPSTPEQTLLKQGDHVMGVSPKGLGELQDKAEGIAVEVEQLLQKTSVSLDDLNTTLKQFTSTAEKVNLSLDRINNTVFSEESLDHVTSTLENVNEFSTTLPDVATDTSSSLKEIKSVATNLNALIKEMEPAIQKLPGAIDAYAEVGVSLQEALNNEDSLLGAITQSGEVKEDATVFVKNLRANGILGYKDSTNPEEEDPRDRYQGNRR